MTTAITLPTLLLSDDEQAAVAALRAKLRTVAPGNKRKSDLYEGKRTAADLKISAPEGLPDLVRAVSGWPGTVVDVLEERIGWRGWTGDGDLATALTDIARDNQLPAEAGRGHLDGLTYGCGFISVGKGDTTIGEPEIMVTVESTESCTVDWDYRTRRAKSGLSQTRDKYGVTIAETLYLPNETIRFEQHRGVLVVADRDHHGLGRVPVARLLNRDRGADVTGRSEITPSVIYLTDAAIRTLCGMEINREFYTSPKWTVLNANPAVFGMDEEQTSRENRRAGWKATQGRLNVVPPQLDENNDPADVKLHEFRPAPPTPYIEQIRAYSQLLAAESGIPAPYLGFVTDNPASADAIRQQEYRLVKRAERRQTSFGQAWLEVARLALMMRDAKFDPTQMRRLGVSWADAATPTRAASADEVAKLVAAEVLPPDSPVTWDRIGLSDQEQQQLADRQRTTGSTRLLDKLLGANLPPVPAPAAAAAGNTEGQ
ncbi:hypothetical protein MINS_12370 [Mycolicibacterium insubricum]|uniref:Uncharacterized protein n=1 Tax=Mycolicibacterium insubricum TaxID=444597 RepID=A0A1X0CRN0_9MYCO|nr:phage portal protein [Mycolicibacterium insubricum]MCV7083276.1 phage portal protein [Mycolicibacterium insubricum]ORA62821.1 hypothetical protein BST26_20670 [Mycolicibacterium insubricum]BBZ65808.1 hypothetical protein MINS_12370 [Mycolicibacterium insubricum]